MSTATLTKPDDWVARIHPRSPAKGFFARTLLVSGSGYPKFDVRRGWYTIDASIVDRLKAFRNRHNDPDSKPVFQVCGPSANELSLPRPSRSRMARAWIGALASRRVAW